MKQYLLTALLPVALVGTATAVEGTFFPGSEREDSPRVAGYYQSQCMQWSEADWIESDQRASYMRECVQSMAEVRPIGWDDDSEGE